MQEIEQTMICGHTLTDYEKMIHDFHGSQAPGLIIGGFMVDLAMQNLPEGEFFDRKHLTNCQSFLIELLFPVI